MATPYPMRKDLTAEYVRSLLDYDPNAGIMFGEFARAE